MTDDAVNQLFWEDVELSIDEERHSNDFQNDEDIDHMEVEVIFMVDQTPYPPIQYIYMCSRNMSVDSESRDEELHQED